MIAFVRNRQGFFCYKLLREQITLKCCDLSKLRFDINTKIEQNMQRPGTEKIEQGVRCPGISKMSIINVYMFPERQDYEKILIFLKKIISSVLLQFCMVSPW